MGIIGILTILVGFSCPLFAGEQVQFMASAPGDSPGWGLRLFLARRRFLFNGRRGTDNLRRRFRHVDVDLQGEFEAGWPMRPMVRGSTFAGLILC